jgi:hypothetical protein
MPYLKQFMELYFRGKARRIIWGKAWIGVTQRKKKTKDREARTKKGANRQAGKWDGSGVLLLSFNFFLGLS